ncbi:MAG: hypothetical protein UW81_C0008G0003 [Candidatus Giovannonibacteria bacterium GW2011_GWC2_44_9]|uniref:Uncharacterized protein n=1 Tax=Candidatus Giovannonibacteria bacterium GW2011_GWC2_44_9 TaxID=1618658 RepID=A0A0G1KKA9_9BACT|nr:MAG: hypothetical protein UW81_C0008G0003 [Candidatus Giovannonibacteria bacterium GW2011_GWC2_44_9]
MSHDKLRDRIQVWFVAFVLFIVVLAGIIIGRLVHQGALRSK